MSMPGTLDFAKLAQEAEKSIETLDSAAPPVEVKETETSPSVEEVKEKVESVEKVDPPPTPDPTASESNVRELTDTDKVKVKIDGVEQVIEYKEYKDLLRKNATVTQRMQQFAKSREEFNAEVQRKLAELQQYEAHLKAQATARPQDPLYETLVNALKGQIQEPKRDPNEIVTLGDVQRQREELLKQFEESRSKDRENFEQMLQQAAQKVQEQAQIQKERQLYLNGLDGILKKDDFRVLNEVIPNFSASVMFHVQQMGPKNLEEALEWSEDYIKDRSEAFKKFTVAAQQTQQAQAAKQKMEPTDGATPSAVKTTPSTKKFIGKNGKLDWNGMLKESLAAANRMG